MFALFCEFLDFLDSEDAWEEFCCVVAEGLSRRADFSLGEPVFDWGEETFVDGRGDNKFLFVFPSIIVLKNRIES